MKNFIGQNDFIWFLGVVEDRFDPVHLGRVRVRCFGWHTDDKVKIPTEELPWAVVVNATDSGAINGVGKSVPGIVEGTWVVGFFLDGSRAQEPAILGTMQGVYAEQPDQALGFSDPRPANTATMPWPPELTYAADGTGVTVANSSVQTSYPRVVRETDVNRLAVGDTNVPHPALAQREAARQANINITGAAHVSTGLGGDTAKAANNHTEPVSAYNAQYPYNRVNESESGHIVEFDDTPGQERISEFHRTGTGYEVRPDGTRVEKISADHYRHVYESEFIHVEKDSHIVIDKGRKIFINADGEAGNDLVVEIGSGGGIYLSVVSGDINVHAQDGNVNMKVNGDVNASATGNLTADVTGSAEATVGQSLKVTAGGTGELSVAGSLKISSGGACDITAGGNMQLSAPKIDLN